MRIQNTNINHFSKPKELIIYRSTQTPGSNPHGSGYRSCIKDLKTSTNLLKWEFSHFYSSYLLLTIRIPPKAHALYIFPSVSAVTAVIWLKWSNNSYILSTQLPSLDMKWMTRRDTFPDCLICCGLAAILGCLSFFFCCSQADTNNHKKIMTKITKTLFPRSHLWRRS